MPGFGIEHVMDSGYSYRMSNQIFKKAKEFRDLSPEDYAQKLKKDDEFRHAQQAIDRRLTNSPTQFIPDDASKILTPPDLDGCKVKFFKAGGFVVWNSGWWGACAQYVTQDTNETLKYPDWTLLAFTGGGYKYEAAQIRSEMIAKHGEDVYQSWKEKVMADAEGRRNVLDCLADWLGQNKKIGLSYVNSPSSERLLKSHGIRIQRGFAFIYPHYKSCFYPRDKEA